MKKWKLIAVIAMIGALFSGCSSITQLKEMSIIQGVGIDIVDEEYDVTVQVFDLGKAGGETGESGGNITTTYSAVGKSLSLALADSQKELDRETFMAQNKLIVLSADTADNYLENIIDFFARAQECRPDVQIAMTRGSAREIMEADCRNATIPAEKIQESIINGEYNAKSVNCMILDVANQYIHEASDVYMPVVEAFPDGDGENEHTNVSVDGIAVFRENRLAGYLDAEETRGFLMIHDNIKNAMVGVESNAYGTISVQINSSNTKTKVRVENGEIIYSVDVSCKFTVNEIENALGVALTNAEAEGIEQLVNAHLQNEIDSVLHKCLKEYRSDVFKIGRMLSIADKAFYDSVKDDWNEHLEDIKYEINVDSTLKRLDSDAKGE